jgi:general secretion pathway protein K
MAGAPGGRDVGGRHDCSDKDSSSGSTRDAFVDFEATDAQGRYNLRRLFGDDGKPVPAEVAGLRRLCDAAGAGTGTADLLVSGLASAWYGSDDSAPVPPQRVEQLVWLGLDNATVQQLLPHLVILLPVRTPVNANTATAAALTAAIDGSTGTTAQAHLQAPSRQAGGALRRARPASNPSRSTRHA